MMWCHAVNGPVCGGVRSEQPVVPTALDLTLSALFLSPGGGDFTGEQLPPREAAAPAMVSWNDGETSTESLCSEPEGPMTIYDSDFCGLHEDDQRRCDCHGILKKFVGFESSDTGRRFLGCSCVDGFRCGRVEWIDNEWPMSLKKALWALWEKYEEEKDGRRREALETSFKIFSLGKDKEELEKMVHTLQCELHKLEKEKQVQEVPERLLNVVELLNDEKVLRLKAEKERDDLKAEKKKWTNVMADLFKALQVNKEKLKKIQDVLSE